MFIFLRTLTDNSYTIFCEWVPETYPHEVLRIQWQIQFKPYPTLVHKLQSKFSFSHMLCSTRPWIGPANKRDLKSTFFLVLSTGIHPLAIAMTRGLHIACPVSSPTVFPSSYQRIAGTDVWNPLNKHCFGDQGKVFWLCGQQSVIQRKILS